MIDNQVPAVKAQVDSSPSVYPSGKKVGRPLARVDVRQVRELARQCASDREIAVVLGISVETLHRRFSDIIDEEQSDTKIKIRRKQLEKALKGDGDWQALQFLGKNLLGQRDRFDDEAASNNISINILEMPKGS